MIILILVVAILLILTIVYFHFRPRNPFLRVERREKKVNSKLEKLKIERSRLDFALERVTSHGNLICKDANEIGGKIKKIQGEINDLETEKVNLDRTHSELIERFRKL